MEELLSKNLKKGTYQEIDKNFVDVSKRLILASSQIKRFSIKEYLLENKLSFSVSFAAVLLILGSIQGINYMENTGELAINRDDQAIKSEDLNLDIKLKEIQYFSDSGDEVALLLKEIKDFDSRQ